MANTENDLPIDCLVVVNCDVAKPYCSLHPFAELCVQKSEFCKRFEGLPHGCWSADFLVGNDVGRDVDAELHRLHKIECNNVLQVRVIL